MDLDRNDWQDIEVKLINSMAPLNSLHQFNTEDVNYSDTHFELETIQEFLYMTDDSIELADLSSDEETRLLAAGDETVS